MSKLKCNFAKVSLTIIFSLLSELSLANCSLISGSDISIANFDPVALGGLTPDSAAFQNAFDCLESKINSVNTTFGGSIYIPAGTYNLSSQIQMNITNALATGVTISGDGWFNSKLHIANGNGAFSLGFASIVSTLTVENIGLFAAQSNTGTAVFVDFPDGGNAHRRNVIVKNIVTHSTQPGVNYFNIGIRTNGGWRNLVENSWFLGVRSATETDATTHCVLIEENYSPSIQDSVCIGTKFGFVISSIGTIGTIGNKPEGGTINGSVVSNATVGIKIQSEAQEPEVWISDNMIDAVNRGVVIVTRKFVFINDNMFNNTNTSNSFYQDVLIAGTGTTGAHLSTINNNVFKMTAPTPHSDRTGVRMADSGGSENIAIANNTFDNEGVGISIAQGNLYTRMVNNTFGPNLSLNFYDPYFSSNGTIYIPNPL